MTIVGPPRSVAGGVDTHLAVNVAAAVDAPGGLLGVGNSSPPPLLAMPACSAGSGALERSPRSASKARVPRGLALPGTSGLGRRRGGGERRGN